VWDFLSKEEHTVRSPTGVVKHDFQSLVANGSFQTGRTLIKAENRRRANRTQAQEHLTTATAMFRDMDMGFWLERRGRRQN